MNNFYLRFPSLLPILEPEEAVERIMNAILTNQRILIMPRMLYIFLYLKRFVSPPDVYFIELDNSSFLHGIFIFSFSFLPQTSYIALSEFFGASSSMEDFKGRGNKKEN
jgi:all-trans-retinol dehydrogenase (NAD+)